MPKRIFRTIPTLTNLGGKTGTSMELPSRWNKFAVSMLEKWWHQSKRLLSPLLAAKFSSIRLSMEGSMLYVPSRQGKTSTSLPISSSIWRTWFLRWEGEITWTTGHTTLPANLWSMDSFARCSTRWGTRSRWKLVSIWTELHRKSRKNLKK